MIADSPDRWQLPVVDELLQEYGELARETLYQYLPDREPRHSSTIW